MDGSDRGLLKRLRSCGSSGRYPCLTRSECVAKCEVKLSWVDHDPESEKVKFGFGYQSPRNTKCVMNGMRCEKRNPQPSSVSLTSKRPAHRQLEY